LIGGLGDCQLPIRSFDHWGAASPKFGFLSQKARLGPSRRRVSDGQISQMGASEHSTNSSIGFSRPHVHTPIHFLPPGGFFRLLFGRSKRGHSGEADREDDYTKKIVIRYVRRTKEEDAPANGSYVGLSPTLGSTERRRPVVSKSGRDCRRYVRS
jgi:hypothetical protein